LDNSVFCSAKRGMFRHQLVTLEDTTSAKQRGSIDLRLARSP
jgi:hypothetical protein